MANMTTLQILQGVHDWVLDKIDEETANFITKTVNDLVNYYTKSETYTKAEVQQIVDAIKQFTYEVVQVLPTASASTMNKIYLVPAPKSEDKNVKEEYITIQDGSTYYWEMLGTTSIDLSNYYTKGQTDSAISSALSSALASYTTTADLTTLLAQKQDVIQDLADIRSGASAGSTAVQPSTLNDAVKNVVAESGVYDVSANNDNTKFESLSALLSSANLNTLIPTDIRKGGMSIKFVLSSDNKYVQYRLMATAWSTVVADWQGVDDEPTAGSMNLVESRGVAGAIGRPTLYKEQSWTNIHGHATIGTLVMKAGHTYTATLSGEHNGNYKICSGTAGSTGTIYMNLNLSGVTSVTKTYTATEDITANIVIEGQWATLHTITLEVLESNNNLLWSSEQNLSSEEKAQVWNNLGVEKIEYPIAGSDAFVTSDGIWESELVKKDVTLLSIVGRWSCNDSSYAELTLDDIGYNGTFNLKKKSSAYSRLYLDCANLTDNNIYTISFDFNAPIEDVFSTIGKGSSPSSGWQNLLDVTGKTVNIYNGQTVITFRKEDDWRYLLLSYNNQSLTFPMTATISNFRIIENTVVTEQSHDNRTDIAELNRTSIYTCYDRVEDVTSLMRTWETNDSDIWDYQVTDSEIVLTNRVKTGNKYCGFYIGDIPNGTLLELNFHVIGAVRGTNYIGCFESLAYQSWVSLKDKKTNNIRERNINGDITVVFQKTSDFNWLVFASNNYQSGSTIKISNYSLWIVIQNKELTDRVKILENNDKHSIVQSIIPPNYTWEKYMDLQGTFTTGSGQGSCVYEDFFVAASASNGDGELQIKIYNLVSKQLIQSIILSGITNVRTHANSISFGNKYDESDPLPLLYIPSGYLLSGTDEFQIYVFRFTGEMGNLSALLIQTITIKKSTETWMDSVFDTDNSRLWIRYGRTSYVCYSIPSPTGGDIIIDDETPKIDEFTIPEVTFSFGVTQSSNQGFVYCKGRIWVVSGVPSSVNEGPDACYLSVINVRSKCRESVIWLSDVGLTDGTSNVYEPEGIFIWNNQLYISYRSFIAKIKKVDLV